MKFCQLHENMDKLLSCQLHENMDKLLSCQLHETMKNSWNLYNIMKVSKN